MTQFLKQSTAVDVLIGPFVDDTDGSTAETGESPSVKLSKNGQALAAKNDATTPAHDADGYYNCELDATDTNTVGTLVLTVAASANALPVRHEFQVLEEAIYDALFGASAAGFDASGRVNVGKWLGTAVTTSATTAKPEVDVNSISDDATAANNAELDYDGTGYNKSNSTIGTTTTNTDMRGTDGANTTTPPTAAAIRSEVDSNSTQLSAIVTDTNELQTDWANGGRLDLLLDAVKAKTDNLPSGIAKNVALSGFPFLMVDATDFATPETGLTITGEISKDGGAFAALTNAEAEVGNGVYTIDLTQAEMNADTIVLKFTATGAAQRIVVLKTDA